MCWPGLVNAELLAKDLTVYWLIAEQSISTSGQYSNAVSAATAVLDWALEPTHADQNHMSFENQCIKIHEIIKGWILTN